MAQPEIKIEQGVLRGSIATDNREENFYKFQGIPYAKPPINELRFKAPQPPDKWTGVLDATKHRDICFHKDPFKAGDSFGSEDCLFLNVYTKEFPGDAPCKLRPVLFWIHGGGFFFGSGNEELYGPEFLITEDVVLVTINYRLGLFGFLSFEDPVLEIPGNAGLKDQVMALKWVQKNIRSFGGDPDNVTIFGESAGAAAVHLLVLSPLARGLFHKAILQSGCAINPWPRGTKSTEFLAKSLGLEKAEEETLYNVLMKKSKEEILEIQANMISLCPSGQIRPMGFVIENKSPEAFLDTEPLKLMSLGRYNHVPMMVGYTTGEGMIFKLLYTREVSLNELVPWNFDYTKTEAVVDKIKKFYMPNGDDEIEKINIMSDSQFIYGLHETVLTHLKTSTTPIYLYRMSIETELNFLKKYLQIQLPGVSHFDDVGYLFKNFATPKIISDSIEDISLRRFVRLWANFAKFANPTPNPDDPLVQTTWERVKTNLNFLDIGKDLVVSSNPYSDRIRFWKQLFAESPAGQHSV